MIEVPNELTIKPKIRRSSSLTELGDGDKVKIFSEFGWFGHIKLNVDQLDKITSTESLADAIGDGLFTISRRKSEEDLSRYKMDFNRNMSTSNPADELPASYGSNFANEFIKQYHDMQPDPGMSSADDASSIDVSPSGHKAVFPFKPTPSGNFKVQSNQVVFQSSTVGVLLADPTQAKVKVKFEGSDQAEDSVSFVQDDHNPRQGHGGSLRLIRPSIKIPMFRPSLFRPETKDAKTKRSYSEGNGGYGHNSAPNKPPNAANRQSRSGNDDPVSLKPNPLSLFPTTPNYVVENAIVKSWSPVTREDKGKDLVSLGYTIAEPVDWQRVQLPKKLDLYQEFYKRVQNHVNPDTLVVIGNEQFHCHLIVLQIYSNYFDMINENRVELPYENVSPEAFKLIYDWMVHNGNDCQKLLNRSNVIDLFCAAQFLSIKDLEEQCWAFILDENLFTEDTAFALFKLAKARGLTPVMDIMAPRVMRFFLPLVASKDFIDLSIDEVLIFLQSNYVCLTSEIEILMAAIRWLYGQWPERKQYLVELMKCVRFGLISPWQLVDIKRNPDNPEILEVINEPQVQQMVDDGLAYVIIKYWYGNNSKNYYHWIDVLGLVEPAERNWFGEEKNHVTYKDFLKYLEQFMAPKEQMYQQMALQPPRRSEDLPGGSLRGLDMDKIDKRRPKLDFPLPATLRGLNDKDRTFPTMSEFFDSRRKANEASSHAQSPRSIVASSQGNEVKVGAEQETEKKRLEVQNRLQEQQLEEQKKLQDQIEEQKQQIHMLKQQQLQIMQMQATAGHVKTESPEPTKNQFVNSERPHETRFSETSSTLEDVSMVNGSPVKVQSREDIMKSGAASYLASAAAALSSVKSGRAENSPRTSQLHRSPQISLFNDSKEAIAKLNMNKLSSSVLGPPDKSYIGEGSLFNWDRETVLIFGGLDPHTAYNLGRNTGKDIYRFDPLANVWESVGELPEPRHHHAVAFLRGRVFLAGGSDPRDDDVRGKSVVVSTVWSFEPVTRAWYSESGMTVPRKNFGLVVHKMALYAIGGQDKKGRVLRSVERFDPKTGTWSEMRPMKVARMGVACTRYRDYIWAAGGMTGDKKHPLSRSVECYNSKTNEWTEINSLRFPRCFASLFTMNDKLYLIGGAGKISEKEKVTSSVSAIDLWDWKDREWKIQTDMSIPRHGHALAYLGTQLIIIGGVTTVYMRALNNVESFCCERMAWIRGVAALPSPLSGHGAVTLPPASLM